MVTATATVGVLALGGTACGEPERSAKAYCDRYESGFDTIKQEHPDVDQYSTSDQNPLLMLLSVTAAYGDIIALIGDMAKVAPDPVQTDVQRVRDALQKQTEGVGDVIDNPLGALANQFMTAVTSSGALNRMDKYTLEHCGEHMFTASPQQPT